MCTHFHTRLWQVFIQHSPWHLKPCRYFVMIDSAFPQGNNVLARRASGGMCTLLFKLEVSNHIFVCGSTAAKTLLTHCPCLFSYSPLSQPLCYFQQKFVSTITHKNTKLKCSVDTVDLLNALFMSWHGQSSADQSCHNFGTDPLSISYSTIISISVCYLKWYSEYNVRMVR